MTENERSEELQSTLLEADRLSEEGEDGQALDLLLAAEEGNKDDPTLLCMIGALASGLGIEGMAVDYFTRCIDQSPTDPEVLIVAGSGLAAAGDPGAEPALRLAALTAPNNAAARANYGALLVRTGLIEQGLEELETARSLDPDDAETRRALGVAYLLLGRTTESLDELETAVEADPEDVESRLLWGLVLLSSDELTRAAEALYPLGEAMAQDGTVQLILALAFRLEGWEEEGWVAFSRAEEAQPPVDGASLREVEDALAGEDDAVREILFDELAPMALRQRMFPG